MMIFKIVLSSVTNESQHLICNTAGIDARYMNTKKSKF